MTRRGERGFALLIVLWTLPLLALLGSRMLGAAGGEARIAANLRDAERLRAAAEGEVQAAAFHVLDRGGWHWDPDGAPYASRAETMDFVVTVSREADRINANTASPALLAALLTVLDQPRTVAAPLAGAIAAGRTTPFRTVDDLAAVPGMTRPVLDRLRPHLTVSSLYGPDRATPDPAVAAAVAAVRQQGGELPQDTALDPAEVIRVQFLASAADARFTCTAILRLDPGAPPGQRLALLGWAEGVEAESGPRAFRTADR